MSDQTDQDREMIAAITRAVRAADEDFERSGGSSRHWVDECFMIALDREGLKVVADEDDALLAAQSAHREASEAASVWMQEAQNQEARGDKAIAELEKLWELYLWGCQADGRRDTFVTIAGGNLSASMRRLGVETPDPLGVECEEADKHFAEGKLSDKLREVASEVIDGLCVPGHVMEAPWKKLCLLTGRYCEPFLDRFKGADYEPEGRSGRPGPTPTGGPCLRCGNPVYSQDGRHCDTCGFVYPVWPCDNCGGSLHIPYLEQCQSETDRCAKCRRLYVAARDDKGVLSVTQEPIEDDPSGRIQKGGPDATTQKPKPDPEECHQGRWER